jgi:hypothetical protein
MESLLNKINVDEDLIYGNPMMNAIYAIDGMIVKTMSVRNEDVADVVAEMEMAEEASHQVLSGKCAYFPIVYASGKVPKPVLERQGWEIEGESMYYMVMEDCGMTLGDYLLSVSPEYSYPDELSPSSLMAGIMHVFAYMIDVMGLFPTDVHMDNILISMGEDGYTLRYIDFEHVVPMGNHDRNILPGAIIEAINNVATLEYVLQFPSFPWNRSALSSNKLINVATMQIIDEHVDVVGAWDWYNITMNCSMDEIMHHSDLPWDIQALSYR